VYFLQNDNPDSSSQNNADKHDVNGSDGWEEMDAVSKNQTTNLIR